MEYSLGVWILTALIAAIVALDTAAAFMTLLGQPVITGFFIGILFGNWQIGLTSGLLVQLIWINVLPLGSKLPPEIGVAGFVASTVTCALVNQGFAWDGWPLVWGLFWAGLAAWLGSRSQFVLRQIHDRMIPLFDLAVSEFNQRKITGIFSLGLINSSLVGICVAWVPARLAVASWELMEKIPFIMQRPDVHFPRGIFIALGGVALAKMFLTRSRLAVFIAPILITALYFVLTGTFKGDLF